MKEVTEKLSDCFLTMIVEIRYLRLTRKNYRRLMEGKKRLLAKLLMSVDKD